MGRAARAGDDDFQTARARAADIFFQAVRIAVGGNHLGLRTDAEFRQGLGGGFHHRPVGIAAHQDAHEGGVFVVHDLFRHVN